VPPHYIAPAIRLVFYFACFMTFLYFVQDRLLYYPRRYDQTVLAQLSERAGLRAWPTPQDYRGFIVANPANEAAGNVIVLHGNAGSAADRTYYREFLPADLRIILLEYPGYGARNGEHDEGAYVADGAESLRLIRQQYQGPLYVLGESLGAAVATGAVAKSGIAVDGVILCTPWDNLPSLAQAIYWFLPVKALVRARYDNVESLKSYRGPLGVIVAERDEIVPRRSSLNVYEAYAGPKRLWVVQGSHNTWLNSTDPKWWQAVFRHLRNGAA